MVIGTRRSPMQQILMLLKILLPATAALAFCLLPRWFNSAVFGVFLTQQQRASKTVKNIILLYEVSTAVSGGILIIVNLFLQLRLARALSDLVFIGIVFAILAFSAAFYAMAAKATNNFCAGHASATQTTKQPQRAEPLNTAFTEGQLCPSLWWYLLHCALIAACALILYVTYDNISPYVSLWADFSGTAVWVVPKSVQAVALPIVVQIMITLICFIIAVRIKDVPLRLKGVNAQAELNRSRKRRAVWSAFLCVLAFIADLTLYAYIHFMFLIPQYKAYVPVIIYAALLLTLALTLFLAYLTREK